MPKVASNRLDELLDLQRQGWLDGDAPDIEVLLRKASIVSDSEALLDLIYGEVVVREELGEFPTLEDYVARYPQLAAELKVHFEVHRAMEQGLEDDTANSASDPSWPDPAASRSLRSEFPTGYDVRERLGQGGMAIVYRAHDRSLHRDVALKLFDGERLPTRRETMRLKTEAEAMARLSHPHIIQIYAVGEVAGRPFLALELAERGTLAQHLQRLRYAPQEAAELIETLARAIAHAHQQRIVHRDLKPANVLFTRDGLPKISDFGLAKVLGSLERSDGDATRTGEPVGTPRYMAPEQTGGDQAEIGPATDVYALGNLLYECLVGHPPFVAASVVDTWQRIRHEEPTPPRRLVDGIPKDLETICLHCLQKDPARRYSSAQALADDLARFWNHEPILARAVPRWERVLKWCRRRPAQAALIAVASLLVLGGTTAAIIGSYLSNQRLQEQREAVAALVAEGRHALDRTDTDAAEARFLKAWKIVQSEPRLSDHETSVSGWLDHARNMANQYHWTERIPPRDFDDRRDEAILLATLQVPWQSNAVDAALGAIAVANELTLPSDPAWDDERGLLLWIEADILTYAGRPQAALQRLEQSQGLESAILCRQRAELLSTAGRTTDAEAWSRRAAERPLNLTQAELRSALDSLRQGHFDIARTVLDQLLAREPEHFVARLLLGVVELELGQFREAQIALTACIAQRPRFAWNYFFRGRVEAALGNLQAADDYFQLVLNCRPSDEARQAAIQERMGRRSGESASVKNVESNPSPVTENMCE